MKQGSRWGVVALVLLSLTVSACDKVTDTSKAVQTVTRAAFEDTKSSWRDFFTYHPPQPDPLPQTRYCYQMQSDVVCYDSEQPMLTSKLIGYQDGDSISWVQPGGGSLGASGGEPVALRPPVQRFPDPSYPASSGYSSTSSQTENNFSSSSTGFPTSGSSYNSGTVASTAGQINVVTLPKAN